MSPALDTKKPTHVLPAKNIDPINPNLYGGSQNKFIRYTQLLKDMFELQSISRVFEFWQGSFSLQFWSSDGQMNFGNNSKKGKDHGRC